MSLAGRLAEILDTAVKCSKIQLRDYTDYMTTEPAGTGISANRAPG